MLPEVQVTAGLGFFPVFKLVMLRSDLILHVQVVYVIVKIVIPCFNRIVYWK